MTISDQIMQVIEALCEKFGIVVDWTSESVIPYIEALSKKLVKYEIITSFFWIILMLLFSVVSIIAAKKLYPVFKKGIEKERDTFEIGWELGTGFAIMGLVAINLIAIIVIAVQSIDIIKCITFPEMYMFEYIRTLINA